MSSLKSYLIGFILSILLILAAYFPVHQHVATGHLAFSHTALIICVLALAVVQLIVQLIFFLHLGRGSRTNKFIFAFTLTMVLAIVAGSLWIMNHLNYNMTPQQMNDYVLKEEGLFK